MYQPTDTQLSALTSFKQKHGRQWRSKLKSLWASGRDESQPELRSLRNDIGPAGLDRLKI